MALKRAPADGIYTLGKGRFRVRKGAPLPDGAEFTKVANKPRGRSAALGPSETTEGAGPSEILSNADAEKAKAEAKAKKEAEDKAKAEAEAKARDNA